MQFKNKILSLVMAFVICFVTVSNSFANEKENNEYNIDPLVVDGGIISAPMLATVSTLAVATGIALNNEEDIYKIGRYFYEQNKNNWETIVTAFNGAVQLGQAGKKILVKKDFLDVVKNTFEKIKGTWHVQDNELICYSGLQTLNGIDFNSLEKDISYDFGQGVRVTLRAPTFVGNRIGFGVTFTKGAASYGGSIFQAHTTTVKPTAPIYLVVNGYWLTTDTTIGGTPHYVNLKDVCKTLGVTMEAFNTISLPYIPGSYNDGIYKDKDEIGIYVPSNLKDLVNGNVKPDDIVSDSLPSWDVADKNVSLPQVSNPAIDVTEGTFVGGATANPSVPSEGIWTNIRDFIISLVVPSDTFWTDTFGGFRDNFTKNFPMVDMSRFDDLVVGGKPFPNIYAYGSKIVDGDVINSIVDWLRPIIAGFIMICLMFFNYRKIYKLIRNSEPFDSIAQGSSDFRTGLTPSDPNPYGNLRDTLWEMRNEILRRERGR